MPRRKRTPNEQLSLLEPNIKTAPCVPAIRKAVDEWRAKDYAGVTDTTRVLLNYWFKTDHRLPNGRPFVYHDSQRRAIETLIYLYEGAEVRRHKDLIEKYAGANNNLRLLQYDDFARYCVKMATGSGKTKLLEYFIQQDIRRGRGVCVVDPHGEHPDICGPPSPGHVGGGSPKTALLELRANSFVPAT